MMDAHTMFLHELKFSQNLLLQWKILYLYKPKDIIFL